MAKPIQLWKSRKIIGQLVVGQVEVTYIELVWFNEELRKWCQNDDLLVFADVGYDESICDEIRVVVIGVK